jgi:predicted nucleic-acid-binding protein
MTGVDTNVMVRLLVRDDELQFAVVQQLLQDAQARQ